MSQTDNSNALTYVLGGALVLIGLFVVILLVSVNSQADSVSTSTTVTNVAPTVDTLVLKDNGTTVALNGTATLNAGTTETMTLTGTVSDDNGVSTSLAAGDLAKIKASLYVNGTSCTASASGDKNNCYYQDDVTANCVLGAVTDSTTIAYTCTFTPDFFADSTSIGGTSPAGKWTSWVYVEDDAGLSTSSTQDFEMGTLLALSIPSTISYGTLTREQSTTNSNNIEMTITQYGNDQADVELSSATAMSCSVIGTIPVANQKWSLTDLSAGATGVTALSGTAADTNIAVGYQTVDATPVTKILYWNIVMPAVVTGSCTGTNVVSAIAA